MNLRETISTRDTRYACTFRPAKEGGYTVRCDAFPGLICEGDTLVAARRKALKALELCIEFYRLKGWPLPASKEMSPVKLARMSGLPKVTPRQMKVVLSQAGFTSGRVKKGHYFYVHVTDPTRWTTVPMHYGNLRSDSVRGILKQTRISQLEFISLAIRLSTGSPPRE